MPPQQQDLARVADDRGAGHRARMMTADNPARGAVFASIPITALVVPPSAAQVYLVAAVYGLLMMVTLAGFPSLIPLLVPPRDIH